MSDAPTLLHDEMCESISVDIGVGEMHSPCGCDIRRLERRCAELEAMMQEAVTGFGRILIATSDDKAVRDWTKRARALLENRDG